MSRTQCVTFPPAGQQVGGPVPHPFGPFAARASFGAGKHHHRAPLGPRPPAAGSPLHNAASAAAMSAQVARCVMVGCHSPVHLRTRASSPLRCHAGIAVISHLPHTPGHLGTIRAGCAPRHMPSRAAHPSQSMRSIATPSWRGTAARLSAPRRVTVGTLCWWQRACLCPRHNGVRFRRCGSGHALRNLTASASAQLARLGARRRH